MPRPTPLVMNFKKNIVIWVGVLFRLAGSVQAADWYVATNGNDSADGTTWSTAKLTIQAGVDAASDGDIVFVSNGVYDSGGAVAPGQLITNRVCITNAITLRAMAGPENTFIRGQGPEGSNAVRGVYMTDGAKLDGFTITSGCTYNNSWYEYPSYSNRMGGGLFCLSSNALVTNCIIAGNTASAYAGGVHYGTLNNCVITSNTAGVSIGGAFGCILNNSTISDNNASYWKYWGVGAVSDCVMSNCVISGNRAGVTDSTLYNCILSGNYGVGANNSTLSHCSLYNNLVRGAISCTLNFCTVSNNTVDGNGGGALNCTLNNCIISGNRANVYSDIDGFGGGVSGCTLNSCLLLDNWGDDGGGGAHNSTLNNCTITANGTDHEGGGTYGGNLRNCIVFGNYSDNLTHNIYFPQTVSNTCSLDGVDNGVNGCITNDPLFIDSGTGNFRLMPTSPCLDAGGNAAVLTETDLEGNQRIAYGAVDMGAFEAQLAGPGTWSTAITNGLTNDLDCVAGDGIPNLLKYATGSSPRISDALANLDGSASNGGTVLIFNRNLHATDVVLTVEGSDVMLDGAEWLGLATNINGSWGGAMNVSESGSGEHVEVTVEDTLPLLTNRFLRLKVTRP